MAKIASFEVLALGLLMFHFFWNVILCHWVSGSRLLEGLQCFHRRCWTLKTICYDPLKYRNLCSQQQSITFQEFCQFWEEGWLSFVCFSCSSCLWCVKLNEKSWGVKCNVAALHSMKVCRNRVVLPLTLNLGSKWFDCSVSCPGHSTPGQNSSSI
jgi:hypothetical protein